MNEEAAEQVLELDYENDPQLNGIVDEIEANPMRFVDKTHAHGFVIALERHFKRIHERLEQSGYMQTHPEETIESRVNRALNELDEFTIKLQDGSLIEAG